MEDGKIHPSSKNNIETAQDTNNFHYIILNEILKQGQPLKILSERYLIGMLLLGTSWRLAFVRDLQRVL